MNKICLTFILLISVAVFGQTKTITGTVLDEEGIPMSGATVLLENSSVGTVADFDGIFSINISEPIEDKTLLFKFIGFQDQSIIIGSASKINVVLKADSEDLDEVVVIGYGTVKKSDLTGSVSSVKGEELTKVGAVSLDRALAGRTPGVVVTQGSGQPGAGANITIRGLNSLSGSQPLYIIDGTPMDNSSVSSLNEDGESSAGLNPLSLINPSDIESLEILKDASATAIYGSRGANGVILITTKSGKDGKGVVQIDHNYSLGNIPKYIDVMDANEYIISKNEALINDGRNGVSSSLLASALEGSIEDQNWQKVIYRTATTSNTNVSFSGGNKELRYLFSAGLLDAKGILKKTDYQRASVRLNLDAQINKKLKLGTRLNFSVVESSLQATNTNFNENNGTGSVISRALRSNPAEKFTIDDETGVVRITPLTFIESNTWNTNLNQFIGNVFLQYTFTKGVSFKTTFTYQDRYSKQRFYQTNLEEEGVIIVNNRGGWAKTGDTNLTRGTNTNQFNLSKVFSKNHKFNAILGQSIEWSQNEGLTTSNYGFANDYLTFYAPNTAAFFDPDRISYSDNKLVSFFGRLNYSFKSKYLFNITGRYDGSSKFAKNNKWAFFPAAAFAYKLSEEAALKNIDAISTTKFRVSYGIVGNQAIRPYQSLSQLASNQYVSGESGESLVPVYYTSQLANPDEKWETTAQFDLGLDLGFIKNRYIATIDYYKKTTNDLLLEGNRFPAQSGFTTYTQNFGQLKTSGFEFSTTIRLISKPDMSWALTANIATGKSVISKLNADFVQSGYNQGWIAGGTQRLIIGEEVGTFYGYKTAGIAQFDDFVEFQGLTKQEQIDLYNVDRTSSYTFVEGYEGGYPRASSAPRPGEQLYQDLDGDQAVGEADQQIIGQAQPDFTFGLNNSFSFGNIDLSFFIDGKMGQELVNVANFRLSDFSQNPNLSELSNAWTPLNNSEIYPRFDAANNGAPSFVFSNRFIEDGSFIRLQNISIGYTIPETITKKLKMSSLRIYASGSNLITWTTYSGYNPDVSLTGSNNLALGHDNAGYPIARTIQLGVNLKF